MDYPRLKFGIILASALGVLACVPETSRPHSEIPKTFFTCSLPPQTLLKMSEQYLEYQKGYTIRIRDNTRGLVVTDWTLDSPAERHRVTLRTTVDTAGSLLSTHRESQILNNTDWVDLPSSGEREAQLLAELKNYIQNSPALKNENISISRP